MGIKDNFEKNLKKSTQGSSKMEFDRLRKTKSKIREDEDHPGKTCEEIHSEQTHSEWVESKQKGEMEEATTASSSGQYSTPQIWAKNAKNWRGAAKPQWPGGKFVCSKTIFSAISLAASSKASSITLASFLYSFLSSSISEEFIVIPPLSLAKAWFSPILFTALSIILLNSSLVANISDIIFLL